jgi:hypothetical protein
MSIWWHGAHTLAAMMTGNVAGIFYTEAERV